MLATRLHHRGDFGGRAGPHDRKRATVEAAPPVDLVRRGVGADENLRRADGGAEIVEQAHGDFLATGSAARPAVLLPRSLMARRVPRPRAQRRRAGGRECEGSTR